MNIKQQIKRTKETRKTFLLAAYSPVSCQPNMVTEISTNHSGYANAATSDNTSLSVGLFHLYEAYHTGSPLYPSSSPAPVNIASSSQLAASPVLIIILLHVIPSLSTLMFLRHGVDRFLCLQTGDVDPAKMIIIVGGLVPSSSNCL